MSRPLNVLMVNYDYPPVGGIGTQRIFHFAKYLRETGIHPIVLTSGHGLGKTRDLSATRDPAFADIKVIRIGGNELLHYHQNDLTGLSAIFYKLKLSIKYFWFGQIYYYQPDPALLRPNRGPDHR